MTRPTNPIDPDTATAEPVNKEAPIRIKFFPFLHQHQYDLLLPHLSASAFNSR